MMITSGLLAIILLAYIVAHVALYAARGDWVYLLIAGLALTMLGVLLGIAAKERRP